MTEAIDKQTQPAGYYLHKFKKPLDYMGKQYENLGFDFSVLTGQDALDVERELINLGDFTPGEQQLRLILRACKQAGLDSGIARVMGINDLNKIRRRLNDFLE